MATLEWDIPFTITTPRGSLLLNQDLASVGAGWAGRKFLLNGPGCVSRRSIRVATDPIPQGDGEIFHDRWANGYEMKFAVQLWQADNQRACDEALCQMRDLLYGHIWSLLRPADDGGRIAWTPSCDAARILDAVRLLSLEDPSEGEKGVTQITFTLDSPFPYAISLFQTTELINGAGTAGNDGNVDFWPVLRVSSPGTAFTITNVDTGLSIVYSGASIGGGDYAEIDTFRGTIYLNGDQDNLKPGINPLQTDFFPIEPGGNSITTTDPCDFLLNDAFA